MQRHLFACHQADPLRLLPSASDNGRMKTQAGEPPHRF
jgi:hypothetical protein